MTKIVYTLYIANLPPMKIDRASAKALLAHSSFKHEIDCMRGAGARYWILRATPTTGEISNLGISVRKAG